MAVNASPPETTSTALAKWARWIALTTGGLSIGWALSGLFRFQEVTALVLLPGLTSGIAQWRFFRPLPKAILWMAPATLTSPLLGFVVIVMIGQSFPPELDPPLYARVGVSLFLLAAIGLAQFFVLRRWFLHAGLWIPTVTIAWLIALLMLDALKYAQPWPYSSSLPALLQLALVGAFLGATQGTITGALIASLKSRPLLNRSGT